MSLACFIRGVDGTSDPIFTSKTFNFTYGATQGNKNVKLVQVSDVWGSYSDTLGG